MSDLTSQEQTHVRTVLRYLRRRLGSLGALADALRFSSHTVKSAAAGSKAITASMALRVARVANLSVDDLLSGHALPGACPRCGYVADFADEPTIVETAPRPPAGGSPLSLVK